MKNFVEWMETALELERICGPEEWVAVCGTEDTLVIRTGEVRQHERPFSRELYGYQRYLDTVRARDLVKQALSLDPGLEIPVDLVTHADYRESGWTIYCKNGQTWRIWPDGFISQV